MLKLNYPCKGLLILIEQGFVVQKLENIDEKGLIDTFYIKNGDKEIMFSHCPCCGEHIQNVITPEGECYTDEY